VICNRVGSQQHAQWLIEAIEKRNGIPVLGCVPRLSALQIPERHLGLFTVAERPDMVKAFLEQAGEVLSEQIDLERLLKIANQVESLPDLPIPKPVQPAPSVRLAVARDEAFCFYYEDNLDALRRSGAEIVPFSPLKEDHLPPAISGIYLGGGYPELYAAQLSANLSLLGEIRAAHQHAMPIYAECGGLMYLTEGIHLADDDYPLVGIVPGWCRMGERLKMGYRSIETLKTGLFGAAGQKLRGHEFHYSQWETPASEQAIYRISPRNSSEPPHNDGFSKGNLHASYIHLHFGQDDRLAASLVHACIDWQNK
jgi:cobyrinic acid a,c-diamide synthase